MNWVFPFVFLVFLAVPLGLIAWGIAARNRAWVGGVIILAIFLLGGFTIFGFRSAQLQPPRQEIAVVRGGQVEQDLDGNFQVVEAPAVHVQGGAGGASVEVPGVRVQTVQVGGAQLQVAQPEPDGSIVARSGVEPEQELALSEARKKLVEEVRDLLLYRVAQKHPQAVADGKTREAARAAAEKMLLDPGATEERNVQSSQVTGSTILKYEATIRARLPEGKRSIDRAAADLTKKVEASRRATAERRVTFGWTILTAGVLALVIFLLYSFLNAGSKGHMAWPLRLVSVAAFLLLCLGLLVVRGHLP